MKGSFDFIEESNRSSPLYQKFSAALAQYLESLDQSSFISVILCGSFAKNKISGASDLDVLIVLPAGSKQREDFRGVVVNGVTVQIFASTEDELVGAFDWERKSPSRQRTSLVAHGVVVAGEPLVAERLISIAMTALAEPPPALDLHNAQSMLNFIENQFPNSMNKLFETSKYGFLMTWNGMMEKYFQLIHQLESKLLPRYEEMDAALTSIDDTELGRAFCRALSATDLEERKRLFFELSDLIKIRLVSFVGANVDKRSNLTEFST